MTVRFGERGKDLPLTGLQWSHRRDTQQHFTPAKANGPLCVSFIVMRMGVHLEIFSLF